MRRIYRMKIEAVSLAYMKKIDFATEEDPLITEAIEYVTTNWDNTMLDTKSTWPIPEHLKRSLFGTINDDPVSTLGANHNPSLQRGNSTKKNYTIHPQFGQLI